MLYTAYTSDPVAVSCVRAIDTTLLSSGILFTDKSYRKIASEAFTYHINSHFVKFVRDCLVQLCLCGFAAFVLNDNVPKCVPLGLVDIRWTVDEKTFDINLGAFDKSSTDKPRSDIFFVVDGGLDSNGDFMSPMNTYMRVRMMQDAFLRNAIIADTFNARPPIYTSTSTDAVFDEREIANVGEVDQWYASRTKDNMRVRQQLVAGSHEFNEQLVSYLNANTVAGVSQERVDPYTKLPHFDRNMKDLPQAVVPLPPDARVASAPRPQTRGDVMSFVNHFETLCCVCFGVNPEGVGLQKTSFRSGVALHEANSQTVATVNRYAKLFEPVLYRLYLAIWGDGEEYDEDTDLDNVTKQKDSVAVLFPSTLPEQMIHTLYSSRVLSHDAYISYLSTMTKMPLSSFEKDHRLEDKGSNSGKPGSSSGIKSSH
jgi:hypothetical protein